MKRWLSYAVLLAAIPAVMLLGVLVFKDRAHVWISLWIALLACLPFFLHFERGGVGTKKLVVIAVMTAMTVVGRVLFTALPAFKPVAALVILAGLYLGGQAGFMTGALTALISNFTFGQGGWTPFQMFAWGLVGLLAGLLAAPLKKHRWLLLVFGALAGVVFSALMDLWTALDLDGTLRLSRWLALQVAALRGTVTYAVSNVLFLLLFASPLGYILQRIRTKYGLED